MREQQNDSPVKWPKNVVIYTDGASRGNPGPASLGVLFCQVDGLALMELGERLGVQTNNFAEYTAVIRGLEEALNRGVEIVLLRSDSELMVKQMTGVYKVKSEVIRPLFLRVQELKGKFKKVEFEHVRREMNSDADRIANEALDRGL